jgi:hypothetical protein
METNPVSLQAKVEESVGVPQKETEYRDRLVYHFPFDESPVFGATAGRQVQGK